MIKWFCGRCHKYVNYYGWKQRGEKPCDCTESPSPWWYVPSTRWQKLYCYFGICKYKGTCSTCDKGPI